MTMKERLGASLPTTQFMCGITLMNSMPVKVNSSDIKHQSVVVTYKAANIVQFIVYFYHSFGRN